MLVSAGSHRYYILRLTVLIVSVNRSVYIPKVDKSFDPVYTCLLQ